MGAPRVSKQVVTMMKYVGAAVSFLIFACCLVSMIVTADLGFWVINKDFNGMTVKIAFGFSGYAHKMEGNGVDTSDDKFIFDVDTDGMTDEAKTCITASSACFCLNIVAMICMLVAKAGYLGPPMAGGMVPVGAGGFGGLLVVICTIVEATACKDDMMTFNGEKLKLGLHFILMLIASVLSLANCGLAAMVMQELAGEACVEAKTEDVEIGAPGAATPTPVGDECTQEAPEGGVYMKNGLWYDKDDNPIQQ